MPEVLEEPLEPLKPCPFCGYFGYGFVKSKESDNFPGYKQYFIICPRCGIQTKQYFNKKSAISAWNRRMTLFDRFLAWLFND